MKLDIKFQTQATLTDIQMHLTVSAADLICSVVIDKAQFSSHDQSLVLQMITDGQTERRGS